MADNIGLFGVSPEQLSQARALSDYERNLAAVKLSPMEQSNLMLRQAGSQAGQLGSSLLGIQDPQMQAAKEAQTLAGQFDLTSAAGLKDLTLAIQERAKQTGNQALASLIPQAAQAYQKAQLNEATVAAKLREKVPAAEEESKRVRYKQLVDELGPQAGAQAFLKELEASKEKVAKAGVAPAVKAAGNISGVVSAYQNTVQPYTDKIDAADSVIASLNEAAQTNSSPAFNSARVALARASGDKTLSRRDIEEAGGDASLAGKILNTGSELFTGVPTKETMRDMGRAANVLKKVAQMKKDALTLQQRDIAKSEFGMDEATLERQFPMGKKTSAPEAKTLDWNTYAAPKNK